MLTVHLQRPRKNSAHHRDADQVWAMAGLRTHASRLHSTRQACHRRRVAETPRRYAWFAPDVTAPIFNWVGAAASLLSNGRPSDIGQARPLHMRAFL